MSFWIINYNLIKRKLFSLQYFDTLYVAVRISLQKHIKYTTFNFWNSTGHKELTINWSLQINFEPNKIKIFFFFWGGTIFGGVGDHSPSWRERELWEYLLMLCLIVLHHITNLILFNLNKSCENLLQCH